MPIVYVMVDLLWGAMIPLNLNWSILSAHVKAVMVYQTSQNEIRSGSFSFKLRGDDTSAMDSADESSSMDSTDSDGSSDTEEHQGRGCIDLTLDRLQSMHAVSSAYRHDRSSYSANGRCKDRIKEAVKNPICACQCRVNLITLMKICLTFWLLSKDGQDSVLWAIQRGSARKNMWHIEGLAIFCFFVQRMLLQISSIDIISHVCFS